MARRKGPSLDKSQVVQAAIRCIAADGPDAFGVSRVARELGIKPPSIYNHVGKGDALARAVMVEGNRRLLVDLKVSVRGVVEPRAQLRAIMGALRGWAFGNPHLYTVMSRVEPDNEHPDFAPIMVDILDLFRRPLAQLGLPEAEQLHAIRGLRAAMHGFVLLENSGQFALSEDSGESFGWLVEAILAGLGGREGAEG